MTTFGAAYTATRARIMELVRDMTDEEANRIVPACPAWTVRDVLGHLTGIAVDATKGELEGAGSPEWTQRQVDERKDLTLEQLLAQWEEAGKQIDGALEYFPKSAASLFIGDTVTHEHDIRLPLGRPDARETPAVTLAIDGYRRWFGRKVKERDLPAVLLRAEGRDWISGAGEATVVVETPSAFDLLRGLTGRRTRDEIAAFDWRGDPAPYLDLFSLYGMPTTSLGE